MIWNVSLRERIRELRGEKRKIVLKYTHTSVFYPV